MRGPAVRPIVIAAGGTGGHFFPAEALASALIARGHRIALMTDARSGGLASAVFSGRESYVLSGAGIAGRGAVKAVRAGASLAAGVVQAHRILRRIDAAAVVGFGGYPSVAPLVAGRLMRRRPALILHEQNAVLGRANRFLSPRADRLALSFETTQRVPETATTKFTGNPVRPAIANLADRPYPAGTDIELLVLGGSLGARVFSDVVPGAIAALPDALRSRIRVTQQCRVEDLDRVRAAYAAVGVPADLSSFFPDVAGKLAAAHLVIARAGASTIAELAVVGRPSILVPLPSAIDDHQTANARALAEAGATWPMPQAGFIPATLAEKLARLLADPAALAAAGAAAKTQARANAAELLANLVEALMLKDIFLTQDQSA